MKNLKRTLSLVLALVLAVGLLTVGASAAFKDDSQITYKEAVELLTGLGVINGYPEDNTFRPTEGFDRGGLAKMVAYFSWGGKDLSSYYNGASVFADTGSYNWAKGSINYGYNAGYIAGAGVNKDNKLIYNPAGAVKGSELAKTLLCVLGYNPKSTNALYALEGANWELNSIRLAQQVGLYANLKEGFDPTAPLTREEAAQIFMNALTIKMVKDYKEDGSPKEFYEDNTGAATKVPLTENFKFSTTTTTAADAYGRPTTKYTSADGKSTVEIAARPVASYTTTVSANELYNKLGYNAVLDASASAYTAIGKTDAKFLKADMTEISADYDVADKDTAIGGNGVITEIYKADDATTTNKVEYAVVQIRPTLTTVSSVTNTKATATKGAFTTYVIGGKDYIVYTSVVNATADKDNTVIDGTIAKDDNVLVYAALDSSSNVASSVIVPAKLVTGKLTGVSSTAGYNIGGTSYKLSAAVNAAAPSDFTKEATYAIDAYGYVVKSVTVSVPSNYIYVLEKGAAASYLNNNRIETVIEANALTVDGQLTKLQVSKVTPDGNGAVDATASNVTAGLYTYTLDKDGKYELTAVAQDGNVAGTYGDADSMEAKKPLLNTGKYANNSTKFFIASQNTETKAWSVTAVTGYASLNVSAGDPGKQVYIDSDKNSVAEIVFVNGGTEAGANVASYVYATGSYSSDGTKYTYDVIVDGKEDKMVLTNTSLTAGLYTVANGTATAVTNASDTALDLTAGGDDGIYGATIKYFTFNQGLLMASADDTTYNYVGTVAANVPVYTFENGAVSTGTVSDLSATTGTMIVIARTAAGTEIGAIYIVK